MRPACLTPIVRLLSLVVLTTSLQASSPQPADPSAPRVQLLGPATLEQALLLGPLPVPPPAAEPALPGADVEPVPEVDPARWPAPGQQAGVAPGVAQAWREVAAVDGAFAPAEPGVWWLAARLQVARWTQVSLEVPAGSTARLYFDGEKIEAAKPDEGDDGEAGGTPAVRGTHVVMARIEIADESAARPFSLRVRTDPASRRAWVLSRPVAPAEFVRSAEIATLGPLAVSPDGNLVARRLAGPETEDGRSASVEIMDGRGRLVASALAGPQARPLSFSPDGKLLLLSRPARGGEGTDLLLWQPPLGPARTIVEAEPDLGLVRWSPDGRFLLLGSARGAEMKEPDEDAPSRLTALRRRVPDYAPLRHLHLLDLESGLRRRLTSPGDHALDDAVFLPAAGRGRERAGAAPAAILYGRTVPRPERPWFATEFRLLDPATGQERLLAEFTGGWEVRPQGFAAAPDGSALAFIGPPDEIGGGRTERNVYAKQVWRLELADGSCRRISAGDVAFESGDPMASGLPGWRDGKTLVVPVQDRARSRLGLLREPGRGAEPDRPWDLELLDTAGEQVAGAALAPGGAAVAFVASSPSALPALGLVATRRGAQPRLLEEPNLELARSWRLAEPQDASCAGPGGGTIEAWWFPPLARVEADTARVPLVLSYYGGSSPTGRGFNFTHQWFAANGYAVLVVNPRGAAGYGEEFADVHVADWGEAAAADIFAVLDRFLAERPEVDGARIGIYGGSYGGFVTEYLVSASERFGAAVSMYGISSLPSYWGQGGWGWTYGDMAVGGATPWGDPELFWRQSPLFRADRITTPLLLLHGTADDNVPPGESQQLFTALAIQDRPVELVLFPGEGHGLSGERQNRIGHREMILEWFDRWLRGQPEAWEARWK